MLIAHGVLAKDDAKVIQLLKERDIVLDMGITSNYLLKVVKSREEHPIQYFLKEGVNCTINSDDPLLFGCTILSEYQMCRDTAVLKCNLSTLCRISRQSRSTATTTDELY